MGSGKTTTTKALSETFPDAARVAFPDIKRLVPNYQENADTIPIIKAVMAAMIDTYLAHGVSVIVEQISKQEGIERLQRIAETHQAHFAAYRLTAPKAVRWERVQARTREMMVVETLPEEKVEQLRGYFEPNHAFYEENSSAVSEYIDSSQHTVDEVVVLIKRKVETYTKL